MLQEVKINGTNLLTNLPAPPNFTTWSGPFEITNGFVFGTNTLDFIVTNTPGSGGNPSGLRVQISGIATITVTNPQDLSDGLVAYYPLNGNAQDASGNGNDGVVYGAIPATDRFGVTNGCMSFDGNGAYISAPAGKFPVTNRTISLWFRLNQVTDRPGLLGYGGSDCGDAFFLGFNFWGDSSWDVSSHCNVYTLEIPYNDPPTNAWYFWAVVMDNNGMSFYVNGELMGARSGITQTYVAGTQLGLGTISSPTGQTPYTDGNVGYLDGCLDDVRIYNRALSTNEINLLYAGTSHAETLSLGWQGNTLALGAAGDPGYSYVIQSSGDLVHWTNSGAIVPAVGAFQTNVSLVGSSMFYRAVLQ
jgi:hypothetical protein